MDPFSSSLVDGRRRRSRLDHEPTSVGDVLDELDELADKGDQVCVRDVLDDFGRRSFGPFMMIPALIEISPLGGIPGVPTALALFIAVIAAQLVIGREHIWMPEFVQRRAVESGKLHKAVEKLRGLGQWLDEHSQDRLEKLTVGIWLRFAGVVVIALCCTVPPLELLPFASTLPMLAIIMIGLGLTVRDGALLLSALLFAGLAAATGVYLYLGSDKTGSFLPF
ncbi:exopolysaccharide biosynthesis protein [Erythrobacter sp. A6_0]|uniref:exopolysaccharide biosynthesis protein n=1 Tax=Erythrobacter sp. A6_0 TaxID=2821089 RepID=UPI0032AE9C56